MTPLERITERVTRDGHPDAPDVPACLLSLAEFFDGNDHVGSIGCNLSPTPRPNEFYDLLRGIATRSDVKDVRVQITMFDDPEWPFSDTVFVMTSAPVEDVESWFPADWKPDEVWEGFVPGRKYEPYAMPEGVRPVACWWD